MKNKMVDILKGDYKPSLKDFVGKHKFSGIELSVESRPTYEGSDYNEDAEVCRFMLDGVTWEIAEDPNDGYRSSAREPIISPVPLKNVFKPVDVLCTYQDKRDRYGSEEPCDILNIYNAETGALILAVGTDNIYDYYPSFICNFSAENIGEYK